MTHPIHGGHDRQGVKSPLIFKDKNMGEPIAEVGYKAGVCGHDDTDWQKVGISASGRLKVETEDPSGADLTDVISKLSDILTELNAKLETADVDLDGSGRLSVNQHQYDGSAWRKSNLLFGYNDVYGEWESEDNVGAGTNYLTFSTVPAGEVWVVTFFVAYCLQANPSSIQLWAKVGGVSVVADTLTSVSAYALAKLTGTLYLKEDDYLWCTFLGCSAGDDTRAAAGGYKMSIDM